MTRRHRAIRGLAVLTCLIPGFASVGAQKGGAAKETPVSVTMRDGEGDRIRSDGAGAYVHDVDGVRAVLVSNGNLALKTHFTSSLRVRELQFDFGHPVSPGTEIPFGGSIQRQGFLSTSCGNPGGVRDMPVGSDQYCAFEGYFQVPGTNTQWFIRFDPSVQPSATRVLVGHPDADTWEIEASGTDVATLVSLPIKGKGGATGHGDFHMPTRLTVRLAR